MVRGLFSVVRSGVVPNRIVEDLDVTRNCLVIAFVGQRCEQDWLHCRARQPVSSLSLKCTAARQHFRTKSDHLHVRDENKRRICSQDTIRGGDFLGDSGDPTEVVREEMWGEKPADTSGQCGGSARVSLGKHQEWSRRVCQVSQVQLARQLNKDIYRTAARQLATQRSWRQAVHSRWIKVELVECHTSLPRKGKLIEEAIPP